MAANTFAVTGHAENKQITELLPGILNQVRLVLPSNFYLNVYNIFNLALRPDYTNIEFISKFHVSVGC